MKVYVLKNFRLVLVILLFIGSFLIGLIGSYITLSLSGIFVKNQEIPKEEVSITSEVENSVNVLLLGYGGANHDGGNLSDVIILANINKENKKLTFISIPRDLWVDIPIRSDISEHYKVNAAYAIGSDDKRYPLKEPIYKGDAGGGTMAKKVVGNVVGMQIRYFIAVDFDNFKKIIDTLGGLEVNVPVTFDDYFYPVKGKENETCGKSSSEINMLHQKYSGFDLEKQFECRYEHIHFDKGINNMNGETTLKYVRSRHSDQHGGDFARAQRQQSVLVAIKDKLISINAIKKASEIFNQFSEMVKTDIDLEITKGLTNNIKDLNEFSINFASLNEDNVLVATKSMDGQFILIPKEGEDVWIGIQNYINQAINSK